MMLGAAATRFLHVSFDHECTMERRFGPMRGRRSASLR
jgi:hypothetical protein